MSSKRELGDGAVAAGHEQVAEVGAAILNAGGNAVDAVVAMIAAGCVCENTLTSFGGGGFLIAGGGDLPEPVLLDFFARQPGLEPRPKLAPWEIHALVLDGVVLPYGTGPASVAVPGIARGIAHAAHRIGRLDFATLLAPSVRLADSGVVLTRTQAGEHAANGPLILRDPHGATVYAVDGDRFRGEGELFQQPDLARAIEQMAATRGESFYTGAIADAFMEWSDRTGARISRADLAAYEVIERTPSKLRIDDISIYANSAPSMGGDIALQILQAARAEQARGVPHELAAASALRAVIARLDPPRTRVPDDGELVVTHSHPANDRQHDALVDAMHDRGTPSDSHDIAPAFARSPNTTHVSAIDADGMVCGATTTVGYGSGAFIPGTGIQLNNMLAEYDHTIVRAPGSTVPSMMTPAILVSPRTVVQIGSAGSDRIPHAIAQIFHHLWEGRSLEEAILAPRLSFDGTVMHAEPGIDPTVLDELRTSIDVVEWSRLDPYFGTTNGTATRNGRSWATGDVRREAAGIVL